MKVWSVIHSATIFRVCVHVAACINFMIYSITFKLVSDINVKYNS